MPYIRTSGRCIRCRRPFPPDGPAVIVSEDIAGGFLAPEAGGNKMCLFSEPEWVAVCTTCATPKEAAAAHFQRACEGCGLPMLTPLYPTKVRRWFKKHVGIRNAVCSRRCEQRYRRRLKRQERATATCACCGIQFEPRRSDARFCSIACKQAAYRDRQSGRRPPASPNNRPDEDVLHLQELAGALLYHGTAILHLMNLPKPWDGFGNRHVSALPLKAQRTLNSARRQRKESNFPGVSLHIFECQQCRRWAIGRKWTFCSHRCRRAYRAEQAREQRA